MIEFLLDNYLGEIIAAFIVLFIISMLVNLYFLLKKLFFKEFLQIGSEVGLHNPDGKMGSYILKDIRMKNNDGNIIRSEFIFERRK